MPIVRSNQPGAMLRRLCALLVGIGTAAAAPAPAPPAASVPLAAAGNGPAPLKPRYRELHFVVDVDADQDWKKNDPEHPGDQYSKATTRQHYEVRVRARSDGKLEVRNVLDEDMNTRLEAKTIWLARKAKKEIEASGQKMIIPKTDADQKALTLRFQYENIKCNGDAACLNHLNLLYGAIFAAMQYPEALEEDTVPGQFYYFEPYRNCFSTSRVTLTMDIVGVRWNKTVKRFVPFKEHRQADSINHDDEQALCQHYLMVLDTQDPVRPLLVENSLIPSPVGTTSYTELDHTQSEEESEPIPGAARDWVTDVLRHAPVHGSASTTLPLPLSLNGNSTWLGLWTGTIKMKMTWEFTEPSTPVPPQ